MKKQPAEEPEIHMSLYHVVEEFGYQPHDREDPDPSSPIAWPFLMKAQNQCASDFFEKLRLGSGLAMAEKAIPPYLKINSLDMYQWCLGVRNSLAVA